MKNDLDIHVSVIITTYNRKLLVDRAIRSVIGQSFQPDEIIIIDDGSKDGTDQLVTKKYPGIQYYWIQNSGISNARNLGIKNSTGDWIAFLDSDDQWCTKKLETQINRLVESPVYKICYTNEIWIRNGKRVNPKLKHQKYGGKIFKKCLPLCIISPSSVIIHRSLFKQFGLFDPSFPVCEDYDLWLRICAFLPVLYITESLIIKYGGHEDQLSHSVWGMDRYRILALEKIISNKKLDDKYKIAAIKMIIEKSSIFINGAQKRNKKDVIKLYTSKNEKYKAILNALK